MIAQKNIPWKFERLSPGQKQLARALYYAGKYAELYKLYRDTGVYVLKLCLTCPDMREKVQAWTNYAIELDLI